MRSVLKSCQRTLRRRARSDRVCSLVRATGFAAVRNDDDNALSASKTFSCRQTDVKAFEPTDTVHDRPGGKLFVPRFLNRVPCVFEACRESLQCDPGTFSLFHRHAAVFIRMETANQNFPQMTRVPLDRRPELIVRHFRSTRFDPAPSIE